MFKPNEHFSTGSNTIYFNTAVVLFVVFIAYYLLLLYLRVGTDVQVHAEMAFTFFKADGNITPNFLYYFLVAFLAGFSKYKAAYYISSVVLLSGSLVFKFLINVFYLRKLVAVHPVAMTIFAIMLMFIFSLPGVDFFENKNFYLGLLSPNVWHNSTVIFLAPFSIILFFETLNFINREDTSKHQQVLIFTLILLNALIKPSFLFTLVPVVFVWCICRFKTNDRRDFSRLLLPYIAGLVLIALEYFLIYKMSVQQSVLSSKEASSVIISPFEMWNHFSANMPVAFVTSCLFPIVYILYSKGAVFKNQLVTFACINFLFAILIWILFIETGFRRYHGNFYWQLVIANYLLFFSILVDLLRQAKSGTISSPAFKILLGIFAMHFLWGIAYFAKIIFFRGYS